MSVMELGSQRQKGSHIQGQLGPYETMPQRK
jgi:hypothetical protein